MSNDSLDGVIKIGYSNDPERRRHELSGDTGVVSPFQIEYSYRVKNARKLERHIHEALNKFRVNPNREFFKISTEQAISSIRHVIQKKLRLDLKSENEFILSRDEDFLKWYDIKQWEKYQKELSYREKEEKFIKSQSKSLAALEKERKAYLSEFNGWFGLGLFMFLLPGTFATGFILFYLFSAPLIGIFLFPVTYFSLYLYIRFHWLSKVFFNNDLIQHLIMADYHKIGHEQYISELRVKTRGPVAFLKNWHGKLNFFDNNQRVCRYCFYINRKPRAKNWQRAKCGNCSQTL